MTLLKRYRLARGLTQRQVASRAKIKPASYSHYETGRQMPSAEVFPRLAKALGVEPFDLTKILDPDVPASADGATDHAGHGGWRSAAPAPVGH